MSDRMSDKLQEPLIALVLLKRVSFRRLIVV